MPGWAWALIAVGYTDKYPWTDSPNPPNDYAMANIGQVKNLFSFAPLGGGWQAVVEPEYYGLLMFAQAAPAGSRLIATTTTNAQGVRVWATRGRQGL